MQVDYEYGHNILQTRSLSALSPPTVKRKVERGIPNATNSLTPEDPGSILAIVSMRIRTGWLGHANQVHIPTIAKVSSMARSHCRQGPSRSFRKLLFQPLVVDASKVNAIDNKQRFVGSVTL